jgi:hypothetical protein
MAYGSSLEIGDERGRGASPGNPRLSGYLSPGATFGGKQQASPTPCVDMIPGGTHHVCDQNIGPGLKIRR